MRRRSISLLLVFLGVIGLAPGLYAQTMENLLQSVGLLPFDTLNLESYYARVVRETLSDEWKTVYGESHEYGYYYKQGRSPWHTVTGVQYSTPPPTPSVELFFRNYEVRITGTARFADRMCHIVKVLARADLRPALTVCIDVETGVYLSLETYDVHGVPTMRKYVTQFDPNPDLSGIDFLDDEPRAIDERDITPTELQDKVPWLRLPDGIPAGFELIGIQLVTSETDEREALMLHYSDGLARIVLMLALWPDLVENPHRALFDEVLGPAMMASLYYTGQDRTRLGLLGTSMEVAPADIATMLWSMLPE